MSHGKGGENTKVRKEKTLKQDIQCRKSLTSGGVKSGFPFSSAISFSWLGSSTLGGDFCS